MSLRRKLSLRSTLVFALTLALVLLGTFLLFREFTANFYNRKLQERALLAANFYFEKDEVNISYYRLIEERFRKISNEAIRVYTATDHKLRIDDKLPYTLSPEELQRVISHESSHFNDGRRQIEAIYYQDNQGDFIVAASGIDVTGQMQVRTLGQLLLSLFLLSLPLHYAITRFVSGQTFRPFGSVIRKVNSLTAENLHSRLEVPPGRPDEMKEMITTFNYFLERLEQGVHMQRTFMKNASHELKTPLAGLIGNIEVTLNQPRTNEAYREQLQSLKQDALHLKSLVECLLTLSGLQMQERQEMQPVRIDEVLWNVLERKSLEYPDASLQVDFDAVADRESLLTVTGNRDLLFVALSNIIDNAIKFSDRQPVRISASVQQERLVLTVQDQGPGIPEPEREAVFLLFYRGSNVQHMSGHGIGLHLTRQILDRHQAGIEILAAAGTGTVVRLYFPVGPQTA